MWNIMGCNYPFPNMKRNSASKRNHGVIRCQHITWTLWWARWRLKSPASRLFAQPFVHVQIKQNIKAPRHWPLWGQVTRKMFPFNSVIMIHLALVLITLAHYNLWTLSHGNVYRITDPLWWEPNGHRWISFTGTINRIIDVFFVDGLVDGDTCFVF